MDTLSIHKCIYLFKLTFFPNQKRCHVAEG